MKNVLHLIETGGPGGAENVMISVAKKYNARGHKSIVCLLKDGWLNAQLHDHGIETILIPQVSGWLDVSWLRRLMILIKERFIEDYRTRFRLGIRKDNAVKIYIGGCL